MDEILRWMRRQDEAGVEGTFLCNSELTMGEHDAGRLLVYIDPKTKKPVAYQWGGLLSSGILEVKANMRGQGIGRTLVEYCMEQASANDVCVLQIQCRPETSIPFWEQMGFTVYGREHHAFRILDKKLELPEAGTATNVEVTFYPERRKWERDAPRLETFSPVARTKGGVIYFARRIVFFSRQYEDVRDPLVEIAVGGVQIYADKAKYDEALALGVENRGGGAFILDSLCAPTQVS